jgi:hypothetical protein
LFSVIGPVPAQVAPITPTAQATPLPPGTPLGIPETLPPTFAAEATQAQWTALRQRCLGIFADRVKSKYMTPAQRLALRRYSPQELQSCLRLSSEFTTPDVPSPTGGQPINSGAQEMPPPPSTPVSPQSASSPAFEPAAATSPFAGGGGSACPGPPPAPNVFPSTSPLDVAADVSPAQNVEFLNQGLWVYDKYGANLNGGPEQLYQFWCNSPGANSLTLPACSEGSVSNPLGLSDTQIAFDPRTRDGSPPQWLRQMITRRQRTTSSSPFRHPRVRSTARARGTAMIFQFATFLHRI